MTQPIGPRPLTDADRALVARVRRKAELLYAGELTAHRSCGICLAETFNLPTRPYQALRRGGITGAGTCGAIKAGELILGEVFGDPDPTAAVTPTLRAAIQAYHATWPSRIDRGAAAGTDIACNVLTAPFGADFMGPARQRFCTTLAAVVAELVAEIILAHGGTVEPTPIPGVDEP